MEFFKQHSTNFKGPAIYCILNMINGKMCIGSTSNLRSRWAVYYSGLSRNVYKNKHLQYAWNKYGQENFQFILLEKIEFLDDKNKLNKILRAREQQYFDKINPSNPKIGYNSNEIADGLIGFKHSDKSKKNMSLAKIGEKNHNFGKHFSDEHKKNISIANKNSEKAKLASENSKGRIVNDETREKISRGNSGKIRSDETKEKLRKHNLGKTHNCVFKKEELKRRSESMIGNKNPMAGKGLYVKWIESYGIDVANKKLEDFKNTIKESWIKRKTKKNAH